VPGKASNRTLLRELLAEGVAMLAKQTAGPKRKKPFEAAASGATRKRANWLGQRK